MCDDQEGSDIHIVGNDQRCHTDVETFIEQRKQLWDLHPVVPWNCEFVLPTPSIIAASDEISNSVFLNRSGSGFAAPPRVGKTRAIKYLAARVREVFGKAPVICLEASHNLRSSEVNFFGDLLTAADYLSIKIKNGKDRRNLVVNLYFTMAAVDDNHRFVIFIDEAQNFTFNEWAWLKEVQNLLQEKGIELIVIPFGQKELEHVRSALICAGRTDLQLRFLRRISVFKGIASEKDVSDVFQIFDYSRWPKDIGPFYSEFFFPRAYRAGWRLEKEASTAWKAFWPGGAPKGAEVGMDFLAAALRFFLTEISAHDSVTWCGSTTIWAQAVAAAGWPPE